MGNFTANLVAANLSSNNLSNGRVTFSNTGGQLVDASTFTYNGATDLLVVGNANIGAYANVGTLVNTPNAQVTSLTSGRVTFAGTGGLLGDNSNLTFSTDTLTAYNANVTANLNVGTNISATGNVTAGNIATVGTANIGTANIGTLSVTGTSNLGPVGNVTITGGTSGYVLRTDGAGALSWIAINSAGISNGNSNVSIPTANGNIEFSVAGNANVVTFTGTGANVNGYLSVSGNVTVANLSTTGVVQANTANISTFVTLGNTNIQWGTATTTTINAGQVIASVVVSGITGVEFLVKGVDATGSKYSIATVQAVTDGSTVDYSTFGTVLINGLPTGTLSVAINSGNIELQVTPSSTNSTVWTTQFRTI
jgi:filamentous hemagglutinin